MKISLALFASSNAVQMRAPDGSAVDIQVQGGRGSRSYQDLEGLAVDLFNNDPTVISVMGSKAFTRESWSEEFMNYACYCNKIVSGGGNVPGDNDANDELCLNLYKCYKCINVDYQGGHEHGDSYAALYLSYDAQYDDRSQDIQCNDPANSKKGVGNQSHNICSCDRVFLTGLLHNFKKCITREDTSLCYDDRWRIGPNWRRKQCFDEVEEKHTTVNDQCCGAYPNRIPYNEDMHQCCSDNVLRQPGNC